MKYDVRNPQVMPLSKCEFGENQHEESHILFNPLNAELNPICHLLALLGAHLIFHVSRIRVKGVNKILPASKIFFHKCG